MLSPSKRGPEADSDRRPVAKRPRTGAAGRRAVDGNAPAASDAAPLLGQAELDAAVVSLAPTHHSNARAGLRRSIALVLSHDGFDSATEQAMESFVGIVESCQSSCPPHSYPERARADPLQTSSP